MTLKTFGSQTFHPKPGGFGAAREGAAAAKRAGAGLFIDRV